MFCENFEGCFRRISEEILRITYLQKTENKTITKNPPVFLQGFFGKFLQGLLQKFVRVFLHVFFSNISERIPSGILSDFLPKYSSSIFLDFFFQKIHLEITSGVLLEKFRKVSTNRIFRRFLHI